jgi:hypothetical protein
LINDLIQPPINEMMAKLEGELNAALDDAEPGWTLLDVKHRCRLVSVHGSPWQTLWLDNRPLMEFGPVETTTETRDDRTIVRFTRQFRRLDGVARGPK